MTDKGLLEEIKMYNPDKACDEMIEALNRICHEKKISWNTLAKEAGLSSSTISYLMRGKSRPQVYTMLMLCNVLGVRFSELFEESDVVNECENEENLLEVYRGLTDEKREMLRTYIDMLSKYQV